MRKNELQMGKTIQIRWIASVAVVLPALVVLYYFLQPLVDLIAYDWLSFTADTHLGASVNFFIYDTLKILILLFLISSLMGVINAYFPIDRIRIYLTTKRMYGFQYFLASLFGAVTPFCSCSSIPLFIGFVKGGIPLGVTFSFLITSPLVNEVAVAMFLGIFGWKATLIYTMSGILLGTAGGFLLGRFRLERYLSDWVKEIQQQSEQETGQWEADRTPFMERLPIIIREGAGIVKSVLLYVIIGIGIGAVMHGYVPENFFTGYLSADKWYAVPLSVLAGVPMYGNAADITTLHR